MIPGSAQQLSRQSTLVIITFKEPPRLFIIETLSYPPGAPCAFSSDKILAEWLISLLLTRHFFTITACVLCHLLPKMR